MKIELEVNIPEGYEATGEFRCPKSTDYIINCFGQAERADMDYVTDMYIILRKKPLAGQAWVDSLPEGTVFLYRGRAHQKLGAAGDVSTIAYGWVDACSQWSEETCRILYRPEE